MVKLLEKIIREHAENRDVPFSPCPKYALSHDAHQSKQTSVPVLMFVLIFIWIPELLYIIISYFNIFHTVIQESKWKQ
jgi:hypothetical protein